MGNEFKYRYTPLAEVLQSQDPCVVAEAVRRYGCYELDSTEHLVKLDEAGERKVLAMLGELNLINLRQLKERESCATYEEYAELSQSPVVGLCEPLEFHPLLEDFHAWRYGWPIDQLPDFKKLNDSALEKIGAEDAAAEDEEPEQASDRPPYLTTSDLVGCFCGHMGVTNPAKVLSEYPEWATKNDALVQRGRPGKPSKTKPDISKWNPVQFALNLLDKKPLPRLSGIGNLKQQHLDTVFSMKSLAEWKPIWIKSKPL